MLLIAIVLALAVAYGQWQRAQRSSVIHAQIAPLASSTPSPAPDKE